MAIVLGAAFAGFCALAPTSSRATVVTFDDLPGDEVVPQGYGGINWNGNWDAYQDAQTPYDAESPPYRVYTDYGTPVALLPGENTFQFLSPVVFNGAYLAGDGATEYFNLYLDNTLVATSDSLTVSATPAFLESGYSGLVDEVGVYSSFNDEYVMDNVTYNATVPEPTTLSLLGAGLLGLGRIRRKRVR